MLVAGEDERTRARLHHHLGGAGRHCQTLAATSADAGPNKSGVVLQGRERDVDVAAEGQDRRLGVQDRGPERRPQIGIEGDRAAPFAHLGGTIREPPPLAGAQKIASVMPLT